MTIANVSLHRNDDLITATVEGEVSFTDVSVEIDGLVYRDAYGECAGLFPVSQRELERMEKALENEAVEEARDRLEDAATEAPYEWDGGAA